MFKTILAFLSFTNSLLCFATSNETTTQVPTNTTLELNSTDLNRQDKTGNFCLFCLHQFFLHKSVIYWPRCRTGMCDLFYWRAKCEILILLRAASSLKTNVGLSFYEGSQICCQKQI